MHSCFSLTFVHAQAASYVLYNTTCWSQKRLLYLFLNNTQVELRAECKTGWLRWMLNTFYNLFSLQCWQNKQDNIYIWIWMINYWYLDAKWMIAFTVWGEFSCFIQSASKDLRNNITFEIIVLLMSEIKIQQEIEKTKG